MDEEKNSALEQCRKIESATEFDENKYNELIDFSLEHSLEVKKSIKTTTIYLNKLLLDIENNQKYKIAEPTIEFIISLLLKAHTNSNEIINYIKSLKSKENPKGLTKMVDAFYELKFFIREINNYIEAFEVAWTKIGKSTISFNLDITNYSELGEAMTSLEEKVKHLSNEDYFPKVDSKKEHPQQEILEDIIKDNFEDSELKNIQKNIGRTINKYKLGILQDKLCLKIFKLQTKLIVKDKKTREKISHQYKAQEFFINHEDAIIKTIATYYIQIKMLNNYLGLLTILEVLELIKELNEEIIEMTENSVASTPITLKTSSYMVQIEEKLTMLEEIINKEPKVRNSKQRKIY